MRINQKVKYGVASLFELAKSPTQFQDAERIAAAQHIPPAYAHKVLQALAHAGMVLALKGVGYRLAKPLGSITALEVMEALTSDVDQNVSAPDMGALLERRVNLALCSFTLDELKTTR